MFPFSQCLKSGPQEWVRRELYRSQAGVRGSAHEDGTQRPLQNSLITTVHSVVCLFCYCTHNVYRQHASVKAWCNLAVTACWESEVRTETQCRLCTVQNERVKVRTCCLIFETGVYTDHRKTWSSWVNGGIAPHCVLRARKASVPGGGDAHDRTWFH